MIKKLTKSIEELYFYENEIKKIVNFSDKKTYPRYVSGNISSELYGDLSGLSGNISSGLSGNISSGLSGDLSGLSGDLSGLSGNLSGLYGDCSHIVGNLDCCEITDKERKKGIKIGILVID